MQELTEEALVAASVDDVWADFTRADRLQEWMWPPRFESTAAVELRELGRWELRSDVESGLLLSQAMARHPKVFSRLYVAMVEAGEIRDAISIMSLQAVELLVLKGRLATLLT